MLYLKCFIFDMEIWHENSLFGEAGHNLILDKLILHEQVKY